MLFYSLHRQLSVVLICSLFFIACAGTAQHKVDFNSNYVVKQGTKIEVGKVSNASGTQFQVDIEQLLKDSLVARLKKIVCYMKEVAMPQ